MTVGVALILVVVLYFGFSHKPPEASVWEEKRKQNAELLDVTALIRKEKEALDDDVRMSVALLESEAAKAQTDTFKIEAYKLLASKWYDIRKFGIAAFYAEKVAELEQSETAWAIAGSSYKICFNNELDERLQQFCMNKALSGFENAVSINPEFVEGRINMALCYIEAPSDGQPMKGVLMLRDLHDTYPKNVGVLFHLARLSLQTRQFEKATQRIEAALVLEPDEVRLHCLAWEIYKATDASEKADAAKAKCI